MAGTSDTLDARGDAWGRLDLQHEVDRSHVDAKLERRRRDQAFDGPRFEPILDEHALLTRDRSVMREYELLTRELVDSGGDSLGQPPRVDEDDRRAVLADHLQDARID